MMLQRRVESFQSSSPLSLLVFSLALVLATPLWAEEAGDASEPRSENGGAASPGRCWAACSWSPAGWSGR